MVRDDATQVEMDEDMTLRALGDLERQGTSESYFLTPAAQRICVSKLNESFQNVAVDS